MSKSISTMDCCGNVNIEILHKMESCISGTKDIDSVMTCNKKEEDDTGLEDDNYCETKDTTFPRYGYEPGMVLLKAEIKDSLTDVEDSKVFAPKKDGIVSLEEHSKTQDSKLCGHLHESDIITKIEAIMKEESEVIPPILPMQTDTTSSAGKCENSKSLMRTENEENHEDKSLKVEQILSMRTHGGKEEHLLKLKGYPRSESTWEDVSNLNCPQLLAEFKESFVMNEHELDQENAIVENNAKLGDKACKDDISTHDVNSTSLSPDSDPSSVVYIAQPSQELTVLPAQQPQQHTQKKPPETECSTAECSTAPAPTGSTLMMGTEKNPPYESQLETLERHMCKVCKKWFQNSSSLDVCMSEHKSKSVIQRTCTVSRQVYDTCKDRAKHVMTEHIIKPTLKPEPVSEQTCKVCKKVYSCRKQLKAHMALHTGRYSCKHCGLPCKSSTSLKEHENSHTGHKPYACKICGKRYGWKKALNDHKNTIHNAQETYSILCQYCGILMKKRAFAKHLAVHFTTNKYFCSFCGAGYKRSDSLRNHERTHTGEKPFQCELCKKFFAKSTSLAIHKKQVHVGRKSHACDQCGKFFTQAGCLRRHNKVHSGERPHVCRVCSRAFTHAYTLQRHAKVHR